MEFWGVEVKSEPVKVDPKDFDAYIHLSQAALGESKKGEPVVLYLKFDDQKFVLGTLSKDTFPQISFDLVLEKEFELSTNSKNASVYFCGYKAEIPDEDTGDDFDNLSDSEEEEDLPVMTKDNGKPDTKTELAKAAAAAAAAKSNVAKVNDSKKQVKVVDLKKKEDDESDDDDDDSDDSDDNENESSDEDLMDADDSDDEDESDEEETPKKVEQGKKRPNDSAAKTPVSAKKAKAGTPQKTDGKKGGHTATPHPMKKGGKSPNSDAKSGGHLSCKSCSKTFNSDGGLQQHIKAKHTK